MLLIHQAGSVKVGEVVRYTLTYTPSKDRVVPTPPALHLKVKNTAAIPLRAAWVHGPYALHVAAYPNTFDPHRRAEDGDPAGVPSYEPMVKAGGSWSTTLQVPPALRLTGANVAAKMARSSSASTVEKAQQEEEGKEAASVTWIIEIASQILFSNSASVGFEVLVGRDERGLDLGFAAVAGRGHGGPGHIKEHPTERDRKEARRKGNAVSDGVYSKAVRLVVEDTETLWDKPPLPTWEGCEEKEEQQQGKKDEKKGGSAEKDTTKADEKKGRKRRNVHLVIVTHGLHSNIGADMLFLKESIDATVKQARIDARKRKAGYKSSKAGTGESGDQETSTAALSGGQDDLNNSTCADDDEEETIVRGFTGNAIRTENGIQYLGKRLAKYILRFTYPDQPFLPIKRSFSRKFTDTFTSEAERAKKEQKERESHAAKTGVFGTAAHHGSSIVHPDQGKKPEDLPYRFTSISFIGHSLGGLIQTYAIAYIQKHSPGFFEQIKPINFVCMASPMLGLSNENPMYVKFALDFGLVGRSGQDLGLTWRPPTMAKRGWDAVIGGLTGNHNTNDANGEDGKKEDVTAKPLLRVLPTGPAHQVLRLFRNRTVYSNVVNDGIVPLRTSCLLFLDWRGLGKVEKARRENGLIGTMAEWGWAELTGANSSTIKANVIAEQPRASMDVRKTISNADDDDDAENIHVRQGEGDTVPQPAADETGQDNRRDANRPSYEHRRISGKASAASLQDSANEQQGKGMLDSFLQWLRPGSSSGSASTVGGRAASPSASVSSISKKSTKAIRRAQTISFDDSAAEEVRAEDAAAAESASGGTMSNPTMRPHMPRLHTGQTGGRKRPLASRGDSLDDAKSGELLAPPSTSIFESAGDLLHPPLPSRQWITDPSTRARTIFHDRVYHPEDIPPPPLKPIRNGSRSVKSRMGSTPDIAITAATEGETPPPPGKIDTSSMKVEEKIARAYHKDLSWRKVLVRLEPDAHNNIIVRRMFANAYGWPVVKHLCDTHFADSYAARMRDEDEPARERAPPLEQPIDPLKGEEVREQTAPNVRIRSQSEMREARDELADLEVAAAGAAAGSGATTTGSGTSRKSSVRSTASTRSESGVWDDSFFEGSDGEDSDAVDERNLVARILNPNVHKKPDPGQPFPAEEQDEKKPKSSGEAFTDGHRGLAPTSPSSSPRHARKRSSSSNKAWSSPVASTFDSGDLDGPILRNPLVEEPEQVLSPPLLGSPSPVGLRSSLTEGVLSGPAVSPGQVAAGKVAPAGDEGEDAKK